LREIDEPDELEWLPKDRQVQQRVLQEATVVAKMS
jgi:hypothetical protein